MSLALVVITPPPNCAIAISNENRVRVELFSNSIARTRPFKGASISSMPLGAPARVFLRLWASSNIARSSLAGISARDRKCFGIALLMFKETHVLKAHHAPIGKAKLCTSFGRVCKYNSKFIAALTSRLCLNQYMSKEHKHNHNHAAHGHNHNHHHSFTVDPKNERRMALAALLTGVFMVVEAIGGYLSGSLALMADAGHMLADFAALSLAWFGFRMSRRPADWKNTFGFDRFAILAAFVNGLSLFVIAGFIILKAVQRLGKPVEIMGTPMLVIAAIGMSVNIIVFLTLRGADSENLNIRGAVLHVMGDILGSAAAIIAAIVILLTGWMPVDIIVSVLVAVIILRSAWHVVKASGHILLEGAPAGLDRRTIEADMRAQFPQILDVSHIHAWSISQERPMVTLEAQITANASSEETAKAIKLRLFEKFNVDHATVEVNKSIDEK